MTIIDQSYSITYEDLDFCQANNITTNNIMLNKYIY